MFNYKTNKKFFFILFFSFILNLISVSAVKAETGLEVKYPTIASTTINASSTFPQYIAYIAKFSIWISFAIFFIISLIGALRYITSTGNPPVMKDAKNQMTAALLGLGVILTSYLILYTVNPNLVKLKFGHISTSTIPTPSSSVNIPTILHSYNVLPMGQLIKEGIYGRDAMITASDTLEILQKIIVKPKGVSIPNIDDIKKKLKKFPWGSCMNTCYGNTRGCCLKYDYSSYPPQCEIPNPTKFCQGFCGQECQGQMNALIPCPSNFRSLELIKEIDGMIVDVASRCLCESPNPNCCKCTGNLCNSCCDSETGQCKAVVTGCDTQPVACPDAECDTTTIKILNNLLGCAEANTQPLVKSLDTLRVQGAKDPKFPKPPLHIKIHFENGPYQVMEGLLQAKEMLSNYNPDNYNSILGLIESYGEKTVTTSPLESWMLPSWLKDKSDPLSFYINEGSYTLHPIPYYPPVPPIVGGNCSKNNGKEANDNGIKMMLFCQGSDGWGLQPIGSISCTGDTMASQGCAITSLSMLFNYYKIPGNNNPGETLETLKKNNCITINDNSCGYGGKNGTIIWGKIQDYLSKHGYSFPPVPSYSLEKLKSKYFDNNTPVLAECTNFNGHPLHYIILRGYEKSRRGASHSIVYIADPGWGNTYLKESDYDTFGCSPAYILKEKPLHLKGI